MSHASAPSLDLAILPTLLHDLSLGPIEKLPTVITALTDLIYHHSAATVSAILALDWLDQLRPPLLGANLHARQCSLYLFAYIARGSLGQKAILEADLMPIFIGFLQDTDVKSKQYALTALAHLSFSTHTHVLLKPAILMPFFTGLLSDENPEVRRSAARILAHLSHDPDIRATVLHTMGALSRFLDLLSADHTDHKATLCHAWALNHFSRHEEATPIILATNGISALVALLQCDNPSIKQHVKACAKITLANLAMYDPASRDRIREADGLEIVLAFFAREQLSETLRFLGNVALNNPANQEIIASFPDCIQTLLDLLKHEDRGIAEYSAWVLSNLGLVREESVPLLETFAIRQMLPEVGTALDAAIFKFRTPPEASFQALRCSPAGHLSAALSFAAEHLTPRSSPITCSDGSPLVRGRSN